MILSEEIDTLDYIEQTVARLIVALKKKGCLSQDFSFLPKAEREERLSGFMDAMIEKGR